MAFPKRLKDLCSPAQFYFILSIIGFFFVLFQNIGNRHEFHLAGYKTQVPSTILVFILKLIYILFWTWILNLICKDGKSEIAWFLVLIPFIIIFILFAAFMF